MTSFTRCAWVAPDNKLYVHYHDEEWGVPLYDDTQLFEFLVLEGMQAGLSWLTILKRRENYRRAFAGFDPVKVAQFTDQDVERLIQDAGIIRNRQKITAAVSNAHAFLAIQKEFGSFAAYQWAFIDGSPIQNAWTNSSQVPATSPESIAWSKDLKKRGFAFIGPTTVYAHMQACGMVNDHTIDCFRYREVQAQQK